MPGNSPVRSLQSYIEEPEIRILALSSSSIQDQAALITDRKTCLSTHSSHLTSSTGVPVHNCLVFFYGDSGCPIRKRKQGGGDYPCATCGCEASRIDDLSHCFNLKWRSVEDYSQLLQKVTNKTTCNYKLVMCIVCKVHSKHTHVHTHIYIGQAGQQPGVVKPFDTLNITQIKQELRRQELYI